MNLSVQHARFQEHLIAITSGILLALLIPNRAAAAVTTATNSGSWHSSSVWNNGVPANGDEAHIMSGRAISLTNSTAFLSSLTVSNNATLTFYGSGGAGTGIVLFATSVWVSGVVTHGTNMADNTNAAGLWVPDNCVWIIGSNMTVAAGGAVHGDMRGYRGGTNYTRGKGPGGTLGTVNWVTGGAGYGGRGGNAGSAGGVEYGSMTDPCDPGSGSGADHDDGFAGGGLVRLQLIGPLTVNGRISANGQNGSNRGGGGSGGGIYIECLTIEGSGLICANGGSNDCSYGSGGGGGGRIAVHYNTSAQSNLPAKPKLIVAANQGSGTPGQFGTGSWGAPGTVWLPDANLLWTNWQGGRLVIPGLTSWVPDNLVVSNGILSFPDGFLFATTNDLVLMNYGGGVEITNSPSLSVGRNLVLTNGGRLRVWSMGTNALPTDYGTLVSVSGCVYVATNSGIYLAAHGVDGGAPLVRASELNIRPGGIVSADGLGWPGGTNAAQNGFGPGGGEKNYSGGGYGGHGAGARSGFGQTYGSADEPLLPGSGGGGPGGPGGGLIRMEISNSATIDGMISANGGTMTYGGSGGGINIRTRSFGTAFGKILTEGGTGSSKGGGGGRIALRYETSDLFAGTISVTNGGTGSNTGGVGTIYRAGSGGYTLVVRGEPARHEAASPYDYGTHCIGAGLTVTDTIPVVAEQTATTRFYCVGWHITNAAGMLKASGTSTQAVFTMDENPLTLVWKWTNQFYLNAAAATNGTLSADPSGWHTNGVTVQCTAMADSGYEFLRWNGNDITPAQALESSISVVMDRPRNLTAYFCDTGATSRAWTGIGNWFSPTNWNPPGIPSPRAEVALRSGQCSLTEPVTVAGLSISNSATLIFNGTAYYGTNVCLQARSIWIAGTILHETNTTASTNSFGQWVPDNMIWLCGHDIVVASNGAVRGDQRGFRGGVNYSAGKGPGATLPSVNGSTGGAGHGGRGGDGGSTAGGPTYGNSNAPALPGSGSGADHAGGRTGGGLIWIFADYRLCIDGAVSANGENGSNRGGGGSGGGIWLSCRRLEGTGTVSAVGGSAEGVYNAGGGGGGRIAIHYVARRDSICASATNGPPAGSAKTGEPGTVMWIQRAPGGTLFVAR